MRYARAALLLMALCSAIYLSVAANQALAGAIASAQQERPAQNAIEVGDDRLVSTDGAELPLVEPYLAVNPKAPNNMIAGAMVSKLDGSFGVAAFSSFDSGRTWKRHDFGMGQGGDVWVAFLLDGSAVLSTLADETAQLQIFHSTDGGRTWPDKPSNIRPRP